MSSEDLSRFESLTYADFRRMASDPSLSPSERIGFPNSYRDGKNEVIFSDILAKLPALTGSQKTVIEIGPGCSGLPRLLIDLCDRQRHTLVLIDSAEMLSQLPDGPSVQKRPGVFPAEETAEDLSGAADVVLVYSVFHYVFDEGNAWSFFDRLLALLAPGGAFLLGDIPNVSQRKRFFASDAGRRFHRAFTESDDDPQVEFNVIESGRIDDAVLVGLVSRARVAGFDAYVVPQPPDLPMANRREDILVKRP
jgi:hypothetical protein